jgi:HlyD family secretion protein
MTNFESARNDIGYGTPASAKPKPTKRVKPPKEGFGLRGRVIVATIFGIGLIGLCGGWAGTARLSGAVIASGSVLVDEEVKQIQHLDGGVIRAIEVRAGDSVEAGQLLIRLDDVQIRAERSIVSDQLTELRGRLTRLTAERDGKSEVAFAPSYVASSDFAPIVARGEEQLFLGNLRNRLSQKSQLELQIGQLNQEIEGLSSQMTALDEEFALMETERTKVRSLIKKGLTEGSKGYTMDREVARIVGQRGEAKANLARASGRIGEVQLQIIAIDDTARNEAQRELRLVEARLAELDEKLRAVNDQLARTEIRAPLAGTINELNVHTLGGVVTPAERLLSIVPASPALKIEFKLSTRDVDQISLGQPAKLRFSAFNQRTTPEVEGVITRVAAAATRDPQTGESFYLAEAKATGDLSSFGDRGLVPGMPVEVFVQTQEQVAIAYFAKPFTDQFARAFKEE